MNDSIRWVPEQEEREEEGNIEFVVMNNEGNLGVAFPALFYQPKLEVLGEL